MQVEAIKHQGARPGEDAQEAGKRSTQIVGDRSGMNYKQVRWYIRLTKLVPDLQKMLGEKELAFTPAVELSFIRLKHQKYIAVSIEGQQSSPSLSQAQRLRKLDQEGKLNGGVQVPEHLIDYIDYEVYGRDVRINDGGQYVPVDM